MKATELRIGNWYNSVKWQRPVILEITDIVELYYRCDGAYNDPQIDEMIEPIPLTELWLEKFGFKSIGLNGQVFEYPVLMGGENRFVIETDCKTFYPKINFDDCCWYGFKYVHQLQNLYFALTNTELEINKEE